MFQIVDFVIYKMQVFALFLN